jgi:hypothetical protein
MTKKRQPKLIIFCGENLYQAYRSVGRYDDADWPIDTICEEDLESCHTYVLLDSDQRIKTPQERAQAVLDLITRLVDWKLDLQLYTNNLQTIYVINNCLLAGRLKGTMRKDLQQYPKLKADWVDAFHLDLAGKQVSIKLDDGCIDERPLGAAVDKLCQDLNLLALLNLTRNRKRA